MNLFDSIIGILIDDTLFSLIELSNGAIRPPWNTIAVFIVLTTIVIETMSNFMAANHADATVVEVFRSVFVEIGCLENTSRKS